MLQPNRIGITQNVRDRSETNPLRGHRSSLQTRLTLLCVILVLFANSAAGQQFAQPNFGPGPNEPRNPPRVEQPELPVENNNSLLPNLDQLTQPQELPSILKLVVLMTVLSLAPSILIMTTCFVRFIIVLGLLRQALGTQTLPPNQVLISLSLFLTLMVMTPVWQTAYEEGIAPYSNGELTKEVGSGNETQAAWERTIKPLREFMSLQIERTGNSDAVWMLIEYQRPAEGTPEAETWQEPEDYDDVSFGTLVSAFMLSELKTAFIIGFQVFVPFLVIDLVVSTILISMGMMMLPPTTISGPFKLLLFVLIDGWYLTVGMLLESIQQSS